MYAIRSYYAGDLPTPVKYYSKKIKDAYSEVEEIAKVKMLSYLPLEIQDEYKSLFYNNQDEDYLWQLVKAADRISALIKCIEEKRMGNTDFEKAELSILDSVEKINLLEVQYFIKNSSDSVAEKADMTNPRF